MFVIGERTNGMFTAIGDAILAKDPLPIRAMAEKQIAAGANALDINVGTRVPKAERPAVMQWLVATTREVTDICLAIDTPSLEVMRVGLEAACRKGPGMINSTTGQADKLGAFMKLAREFNARIIGLAIDENGVPPRRTPKSKSACACWPPPWTLVFPQMRSIWIPSPCR